MTDPFAKAAANYERELNAGASPSEAMRAVISPMLQAADDLSDALKTYGCPVSPAALANTNNGADMSREARALHLAAARYLTERGR